MCGLNGLAQPSAGYLCNQCNHVDYILVNRFYCFLLVILAIRGDPTPRKVICVICVIMLIIFFCQQITRIKQFGYPVRRLSV